jgi:hypothetical protein
MIDPKDLELLSASQRRSACVALHVPYHDRPIPDVLNDIAEKCLRAGLNMSILHDIIDMTRSESQHRSDMIKPEYLVPPADPNKVTVNALLLRFNNRKLTRLAHKMRLPKAFGSRLLICQHIEDVAARHGITMHHLDLILARSTRLKEHPDDTPGSSKWEILG